MLVQVDEKGTMEPITFASRTLSDTERKYCQSKKKALSVVWACEKFHRYLYAGVDILLNSHNKIAGIIGKLEKSGPIQQFSTHSYNFFFKFYQIIS